MITVSPSPSPSPEPNILHNTTAPASSPSVSWSTLPNSPSKPPVRFSPPLIAMVVIIATAFITITYSRVISRKFLLLRRRWRRWRHRRRLLRSYVPSSVGDIESTGGETYDLSYGYQLFSGLDDAAIKTIPLSIHSRKSSVHECAVCLLEFEDNDYVRTLPVCYHAFHVDCIDVWLKCHANCPLCRASVFIRPDSPFVPLMSARIRPNFDDVVMETTNIQLPTPYAEPEHQLGDNTNRDRDSLVHEITQEVSPVMIQSEDRFNRRDFLLKRSYSFGFERNIGSERLVMEPATVSPWRYRRGGNSFWSRKPSPFNKSRVFSFRYYKGMKSPFFRRRGGSFLPFSEASVRFADGGGSSSRRRKSFASPIFMRGGVTGTGASSGMFSSSRLRSGDPEALLSPERYNRR
uniref:RING-H2 finger protein ATL65 n=1 Tax=Erigeron canadensis TaxID=72917 RepID=UPI001CB8A697|nr:RING-H2 finger protein ATL65 [Erigeron canadensis]